MPLHKRDSDEVQEIVGDNWNQTEPLINEKLGGVVFPFRSFAFEVW